MEVIGLDNPPVAGPMAESSPTTSVKPSRPPWLPNVFSSFLIFCGFR
jgi:hypothetical protein